MLCEDGLHSRSHGLPKSVLQKQAEAAGLPIEFAAASWADYESVFISKMKELGGRGISSGVFGDIDIVAHRQWEEKVCGAAGMAASLPLWQENRDELLGEFISAGFKAMIVTVNESMLDDSWLGRTLDHDSAQELTALGVDACGENGEYHTFVYDGPVFRNKIDFVTKEIVKRNGYASIRIDG